MKQFRLKLGACTYLLFADSRMLRTLLLRLLTLLQTCMRNHVMSYMALRALALRRALELAASMAVEAGNCMLAITQPKRPQGKQIALLQQSS